MIDGRFSCMLECTDCKGECGLAGRLYETEEQFFSEDGYDSEWITEYIPGHFTDAPPIITLPPRIPESVGKQVNRSFQLFWLDAPSCANSIRSAVEELLTAQGVNRTNGRSKTGKARRMLGLHQRIELFQRRKPNLADKLFAIKWIGNAGSHVDSLERDDLLDAYEILQYVLDDLYVNPHSRIRSLASAINRRKAPRSKKRGSKR